MVVQLHGLCKAFGHKKVLEDVNFSLEAGKFYAILGRNGVGKSSVLKILMRMELRDKGTIKIFGEDIDVDSVTLNDHIGYISEGLTFGTWQSLKYFFKNYASIYKRWDKQLFYDLLSIQQVDLNDRFENLSRGQKIQVALSAALAIHPKLLLLDEVTSVLDASARLYFISHLGKFCKAGGTILMATNIVSEVQHFAEHIIILQNRKIKLDSPVHNLSNSYVKLRRTPNNEFKIPCQAHYVEVGVNSDNTISFLIPIEDKQKYEMDGIYPDSRNITIEDLFVYYTRNEEVVL